MEEFSKENQNEQVQNNINKSTEVFDEIGEFYDLGVACVRIGDKWGLINKDYKVVVPIIYDEINDFLILDIPFFAAEKNGQTSFVNISGQELTEFKYAGISGIETEVPNVFYRTYIQNENSGVVEVVFIDSNGVEYKTEDEAAYGIMGLKHKTEMTNGPYAVGDYFNDGISSGIVFETNEDGTHGKIIGFEHFFSSITAENSGFENQSIGMYDEFDGENNLNQVMKISNWESKFPAFKLCSDKGKGWYIPSIGELQVIQKERNRIDLGLKNSGYRPLKRANISSSTEPINEIGKHFYIWGFGGNPGKRDIAKEIHGGYFYAVKKFSVNISEFNKFDTPEDSDNASDNKATGTVTMKTKVKTNFTWKSR